MHHILSACTVLFFFLCAGCGTRADNKAVLPSKVYHYTRVDTSALTNKHAVYAPVYSNLYGEDGNRTMGMTVTLSIRNISFNDSFYVTGVVYYGSQGEVLKNYLDATLVLRPMHSVEFVVQKMESQGGAGANFVVNWAAAAPLANEPMIQTVTSTTSTGVSFITNGVEIKQSNPAPVPTEKNDLFKTQ